MKYKLIPLLQLKGKLTGTITDTKKTLQKLKNFFVIIKEENGKTSLVKNTYPNGETIMLHKTQKRIGISYFNIKTELTPESTHEEIAKAIKTFKATFYKEKSKNIFRKMKTNNQNYYHLPNQPIDQTKV